MKPGYLILTAFIISSLVACAADDPNRRTKTGAAIGAAVGAILGHQANDDKGRLIGAAAGTIAGAAVGGYMDKQQQEFDQALEEEQRQNAIEIERLKDDTLKLSLNSEVSFDFDSAKIKPSFHPTLNKLAEILNKYDRTIIHVVGHTDNVGSEEYNMDLSLRRARSVVNYLASNNVPASRLRTEGRGESEPRDSNKTEAGRQLNRRVEVFVKPIIEGQEQKSLQAPHK